LCLRIAATGFVAEHAGSVAAANALLLRGLLDAGNEIDFFSKPTFVDPRPAVGERRGFRFVPVINHRSDAVRRRLERVPCIGSFAGLCDSASYNRLLVRSMSEAHSCRHFDVILWMGDYARGPVAGVPTVSHLQGPPGTDARSIVRRFGEIRQCAGLRAAIRWRLLAGVRLSPLGIPPLRHSDQFIVGSSWSKQTLFQYHGVPEKRIATLPYPIDLALFSSTSAARASMSSQQSLRLLWLGRIVPRKRLDVFLKGAELAIRNGIDVRLTIAGSVGLIPGCEKLIERFPFTDRLERIHHVARADVPALLSRHDILAQPSDEENFGSSVAEAQACGLPVIVGATNGNADYLCSRDLQLSDNRAETFAAALREMAGRKLDGRLGDSAESRSFAQATFHVARVTDRLVEILELAARRQEVLA
jgi:glycosyltransferase involved in cell wall biosynthesis